MSPFSSSSASSLPPLPSTNLPYFSPSHYQSSNTVLRIKATLSIPLPAYPLPPLQLYLFYHHHHHHHCPPVPHPLFFSGYCFTTPLPFLSYSFPSVFILIHQQNHLHRPPLSPSLSPILSSCGGASGKGPWEGVRDDGVGKGIGMKGPSPHLVDQRHR